MLRSRLFITNLSRTVIGPANFRYNIRLNHGESKPKSFVIKIHDKSSKNVIDRRCDGATGLNPSHKMNISRMKFVDAAKWMSIRAHLNLREILEKLQLDKHLGQLKDRQIRMMKEKIIPSVKENLNQENLVKITTNVKDSDAFKKLAELPRTALDSSHKIFGRINLHWTKFMQSEMRIEIEKFVFKSWVIIKNVSIKTYQFIYECYIAKPELKKPVKN